MYMRWISPRLTMKRETISPRCILTHSLIVLNILQPADGIFASTKEHP